MAFRYSSGLPGEYHRTRNNEKAAEGVLPGELFLQHDSCEEDGEDDAQACRSGQPARHLRVATLGNNTTTTDPSPHRKVRERARFDATDQDSSWLAAEERDAPGENQDHRGADGCGEILSSRFHADFCEDCR